MEAIEPTEPIDRIDRDTDRDYILQASEAVDYGLVDQVISKREKEKA